MEKTYKILKLIILVLSIVAILLGARLLYNTMKDKVSIGNLATEEAAAPTENSQADIPEETQARERVPDFVVYDLEGNAYRLSDFRGKPVILNFWASWCDPCKSEMPTFDAKYAEYGDQIQFMMVNLTDGSQETQEMGSTYIRRQGFSFPVFYDLDFTAAYGYSVTSIPVTYFVDSDGYLEAWYSGTMSSDILQMGIDILLESEN